MACMGRTLPSSSRSDTASAPGSQARISQLPPESRCGPRNENGLPTSPAASAAAAVGETVSQRGSGLADTQLSSISRVTSVTPPGLTWYIAASRTGS